MIRKENECPNCGSDQVSGMVQAFWARLMEDGSMMGQFHDYEGDTDIGPERLCAECQHEWSIDDDSEKGGEA